MTYKFNYVDYSFVYNSIPVQHLTNANQLTIANWNSIINQLASQTNSITKYINALSTWMFGTNANADILTYETDNNSGGFLANLKAYCETYARGQMTQLSILLRAEIAKSNTLRGELYMEFHKHLDDEYKPFVIATNGTLAEHKKSIDANRGNILKLQSNFTDDAANRAHADADGNKFPDTYVKKSTKVNGHALSTDVNITQSDVGLSHVNNTSDEEKVTDPRNPVYTELSKKLDEDIFRSLYLKYYSDDPNGTSKDTIYLCYKPSANADEIILGNPINLNIKRLMSSAEFNSVDNTLKLTFAGDAGDGNYVVTIPVGAMFAVLQGSTNASDSVKVTVSTGHIISANIKPKSVVREMLCQELQDIIVGIDYVEQRESERQTEFEANEDARDAAYADSESARDVRYTEAEQARQTTFETAESHRESAEGSRTGNERFRSNNETTRMLNEDKRKAFEQGGTYAENGESIYVPYEDSRVGREASRISQEEARVAAEAKRVTDMAAQIESWDNEIKANIADAKLKVDKITLAKVVSELPDIDSDEAKEGILFCVKADSEANDNHFREYVKAYDETTETYHWEAIGSLDFGKADVGGVTELAESEYNLWDLDSGVYKLTYPGAVRINVCKFDMIDYIASGKSFTFNSSTDGTNSTVISVNKSVYNVYNGVYSYRYELSTLFDSSVFYGYCVFNDSYTNTTDKYRGYIMTYGLPRNSTSTSDTILTRYTLGTYLETYLASTLASANTYTDTEIGKVEAKVEETSAKSLYNLGAFDTVVENADGTATITRKTVFVNLGSLDFSYYAGVFYCLLSTKASSGSATNWLNAKYGNSTRGADISILQDKTMQITQSGEYISIKDTSYTDATIFKSAVSGVILQYELATPYEEKVIAGVRNNAVDDFAREQWEKGLNLFDKNNFQYGDVGTDGTISSNSNYVLSNKIYCNANTYSCSLTIDQVYFFDINNSYLGYQGSKDTFTPPANCSYFYVQWTKTKYNSATNIMLNKGDQALPYEPYEGKIMHEVDMPHLYRHEILGHYSDDEISMDEMYVVTYTNSPIPLTKNNFAPLCIKENIFVYWGEKNGSEFHNICFFDVSGNDISADLSIDDDCTLNANNFYVFNDNVTQIF